MAPWPRGKSPQPASSDCHSAGGGEIHGRGCLPTGTAPWGRESCRMELMVLDFTLHILQPVPGRAAGSGAGRGFPAEPPGS